MGGGNIKKLIFLTTLFSMFFCLSTKEVFAFSADNYRNKGLCGKFEVAGFHSDGVIDPVVCYNTYEQAKTFMKNNGAVDLAIMTKVNGLTKIIDANVALLDLSVNPTTLTYFYTNSNLTGSSYTYMDTGSLYGGVDGAHIDTAYSNNKGVWTAKVKTGNFTGWISQEAYEIVPITWVKSTSTYTVSNESIRHNYVAKIQNTYSGSYGSLIGPKPTMLNQGTYYSFDGHYFYTSLQKLIIDYKNGNYNNSVNKNEPYYNYYMYLSNHTKTSYSSINIDEYIRNSLGITQDVYGNASQNGNSRLYGKGTFFYYAQEKYGVNAILSLSLSRNETAHGRSNLAINKNNGFGLNAVDSSPTESANWYASFASSILGYASKWVTYGYAHPRDWRYFGPQFGDKWIGMNVKYASDTYWSEKMAANYYSLDKAKGLQDYNYYQLGVVTRQTNAMSDASNSSKFIYSYPEAEDAVVIIGEKQGEVVNGNSTWYKVVSDLNIDSNGNEITSGDYNWNGYVYIPAAYVKKINKGKNGYISPNSVTEYQDKDYKYDLYVENTELNPKVAISTKQTSYYYDSSLQSRKNQNLLKDRYVMVYTATYDRNNNPVSYLVTSDYKFNQKEWVPADSIKFVSSNYAKINVIVSGNQYTWVNSVPEDTKATLISGHYTNSYVPVLEIKTIGSNIWYKVPIDLSGTTNTYGWTISNAPEVNVVLKTSTAINNPPTITAKDQTIIQGTKFNVLENVTANDQEDGNITSKIKVIKNTVNQDVVGTYEVTYQVTDSKNETVTKTITVTVVKNEKPEIIAEDITLTKNNSFDVLKGVTAKDKEDGDLTTKIEVIKNNVNVKEVGEYQVTYKVVDSYNQETTKTITVTVEEDNKPVINAKDKEIMLEDEFDPLEDVSATDKEDGDITKKIKVIKNTVNPKKLGEYEVIYQVEDSYKNITEKKIKVTVVEQKLEEQEGIFYFNYLKTSNKKLKIQGYQTIVGIDNDLNTDINYQIILKNIEKELEYEIKATRIKDKDEIPKKVYSPDGKNYDYSWFNATIDIDDIEIGNYKMYVKASTKNKYSKSLINNKTYNEQATKIVGEKNAATINNNYDSKISFVELKIRKELLAEKSSSYIYNQYDKYTTFEFNDNDTLHLRGNSYSYGANLNKDAKVSRKIIFENKENYKTYTKDLGSITTGNYNVVLPVTDNLDKTRAWYDTSIDLKDIEPGTYIIYITTSSNITDIGEFTEKLGRSLDNVKRTINGKKYSFIINKNRGNRIEMKVEK